MCEGRAFCEIQVQIYRFAIRIFSLDTILKDVL